MKKTNPILLALLLATPFAVQAGEHPHPAPKAQPATSGTVVATENGGRYIYAQIEMAGKKIWFAAPAMELKVGEKVEVSTAGLPMKDFYSKTLDRTFDMVYFVGAIRREGGMQATAELPPNHPPLHNAPSKDPVSFDFSGIEKAAGGKTVAEIHHESETLAGKSVVVRGRVVKVANAIMGKNWVHLRDGSGEAENADLTVTTQAQVELGTIVSLRGTLATDRDFGSGYKYAVLLEDAVIE